jgi:hypothetical protein
VLRVLSNAIWSSLTFFYPSIDPQQIKLALNFADYGVLWMLPPSRVEGSDVADALDFQLASPLMSEFIFDWMCEQEKLPDLNLKSLDNPEALLLAVLRYMNPERLKAPEAQDKSTNYPSEFVFKTELYPVMRHALIAHHKDKMEIEKWAAGFNRDDFEKKRPILVTEEVGFILIVEEKRYLIELRAGLQLDPTGTILQKYLRVI